MKKIALNLNALRYGAPVTAALVAGAASAQTTTAGTIDASSWVSAGVGSFSSTVTSAGPGLAGAAALVAGALFVLNRIRGLG